MKKYELLVVLPGTLDDNQAKTRSEEVLDLVKEYDAETQMNFMGKTRLAYPIKQIRYGYFYTLVFSCETDTLTQLRDKFKIMRDLLRAMITEYNEKYAESRKLLYSTDATGITRVGAAEDKPAEYVQKPTAPATEADLSDINKKLDELLAGDLTPGV